MIDHARQVREPSAGHATHANEPAPVQPSHDAWQVAQVAKPPVALANVPLGHSATHAPSNSKGADTAVHERHSEAVGPRHVPHAAAQGSHALDVALAYIPSGVQSATHAPASASANGCDAAHIVHWCASGPLHVAHDEFSRQEAAAFDCEHDEHDEHAEFGH